MSRSLAQLKSDVLALFEAWVTGATLKPAATGQTETPIVSLSASNREGAIRGRHKLDFTPVEICEALGQPQRLARELESVVATRGKAAGLKAWFHFAIEDLALSRGRSHP